MWKHTSYLFIVYLFLSNGLATSEMVEEEEEDACGLIDALPYIVVGGATFMLAGPYVLGTLGFTTSGVAAKSVASCLMKFSAIYNGGGVPAGGVVATLQSLGATVSATLLGSTGGELGYKFHQNFMCQKGRKSKSSKH